MSEWKEYSLDEITAPIKETYFPNGSEDLNYIGLEHIEQGSLRINSIGKSAEVSSNKFIIKANDVLFGKLRVYFRKVVKPNFEGICSTDIWVFRAKKGIDQTFLFYFLANWDFVNLADGGEGGTRMPRADWNFLKTTKWQLPSLPEQKAIASILSSLDDKIDLLHRQNATLEKLAETLFRQWFVEEAKEEWEEGTLDEILTVKGGTTPSTATKEYWDGNIHWTSPRDVTNLNGIFLFDTERKITEAGLRQIGSGLLPKGVLLMSSRAPVGVLAFAEIPVAINQGYIAIIDDKGFSKEFIYLWLKENMETVQSYANGSTFLEISKSAFKTLQISKPPKKVLTDFQSQVQPFFEKIKTNQTQIRTLTTLRDTLLPKLMNGEIKVETKG